MATIFPHLTSTSLAPTYHEVVYRYRAIFAERVAQGTLRPLVLPYHLYGIYILTAYLCISHTNRPWLYNARWVVLVVMAWWQWKTLQETSSENFAVAFAAGLTSAWGLVWTSTWLVWCRPQFDAKRVERRRVKQAEGEPARLKKSGNDGHQNGSILSNGSSRPDQESSHLRLRDKSNGQSSMEIANGRTDGIAAKLEAQGETEEWEYFWQPYPDSFRERISWILDLITNFRGPGWNWAISALAPLPPAIKQQLHEASNEASQSHISGSNHQRIDTRRQLASYRIPQFIIGYLVLDMIKTTMMKDPYFIFGPTTYALPSHLQNLSPRFLLLYRQVTVVFAIVTSLEMTFMLAPILFSLFLGRYHSDLRLEPWYYPPTWGHLSSILEKGLGGFWGSWWHQTFRFAFTAPTNWAIENGYVKANGSYAKILGLVCAFGISGFLHWAGSVSQLPRTYSWHAPVFFMLQALGITIQMAASSLLKPLMSNLPVSVRQAGNLAFTLFWLHFTCPWLVDDLARGGIWLYEPIPISPLRGLGLGVKGDGWWCWEHLGVGWYSGKHWWESGVAI